MKYFIDTEFIDDGKTIDLISVAVVCEDGRELYLQSAEFDQSRASQWVHDNVLNNLKLCPHVSSPAYTRSVYANKTFHGGHRGQCAFTDGIERIGMYEDCLWRTRMQMRNEILQFITPGDNMEFWGWCAGYDWVAFCQLFGTMMDLPVGWPHYIRDLQYLLDEHGITDEMLPSQTDQAHNALADALYIKKVWGQQGGEFH